MAEKAPLPIDPLLPRIGRCLEEKPNLVLRAATGAGKTTRVPPALPAGPERRLVLLEPRRVAARAAARRMAEENGWTLGREVGYRIRFDRQESASTRILVVTEGMLVQMLQQDPFLGRVGTLVFDEFHERNLHSDLALAMAREVQAEVRDDLRLVVMSATLDPAPLVRFLGGEQHCSSLESEGRSFPVEVEYLPLPEARPLTTLVRESVETFVGESGPDEGGDVLVFLPGVGEIRRCADVLESLAKRADFDVLPLYGDLPAERQDAVLRPRARRKVVLATNVAETSITIDGITAVIDSGLVRTLRFDPGHGLDRLELGKISRASAEQRKGRAGRQAPGRCRRLWTEHDHRSLPARNTPEIARLDLTGPVLELLAWGERDPRSFPWFEAPEPAALSRALELLADLDAIETPARTEPEIESASPSRADVDRAGSSAPVQLRPLGKVLARLPVHPRLGRLLIEGHRLGFLDDAALLAALLSERDVVFRPVGQRPVVAMASALADPLDRLEGVRAFERSGFGETVLGPVDPRRSRHALRVGRQLADIARRRLGADSSGAAKAGPGGQRPGSVIDAVLTVEAGAGEHRGLALRRALLAAFPDRVARRREAGSRRAVMVGGRGVRLAEMSAVREAELFVCIELDDRRQPRPGQAPLRPGGPGRGSPDRALGREALVRQAAAIEPAWLEPVVEREEAEFDAERQRVVGWRRLRYRGLALRQIEIDPGAEAAERALVEAAERNLTAALPLDQPKVEAFLVRVRALRSWMPELGLPEIDDRRLRELLPLLAAGKRSFDELRRSPLLSVLRGGFDFHQLEALDRHAPETLEVPSGSRIRLQYRQALENPETGAGRPAVADPRDGSPGPAEPPILAVRIQELFGSTETPTVADGRVPVLLHLLAPNMRPQQVTRDLASFWTNTYPLVRKELAGRYPKHAWPEDPLAAEPMRGAKRRPRAR